MRLQHCLLAWMIVGCAVATAVLAQPGAPSFAFGGPTAAAAPSFASPSPSPSLAPSPAPVAVGSANIGGGLAPNTVAPAIGIGSAGLPPSASIISPGLTPSIIGIGVAAPAAAAAPVTASPFANPAVTLPATAAPSIAAASPVAIPSVSAPSSPVLAAASPISPPSNPAISSPIAVGSPTPAGPVVGVTATAAPDAPDAPAASDLPDSPVSTTADPPALPFPDRPESTTYVEQIFGPYPYDLGAFMASNVSLYPIDLSAPSSPLPDLIAAHPSSVGPNATTGVQVAADFALSCTGRDTSQPFLDGACNNLNTPWWGQVGVPYQRIGRAVYPGDGSGSSWRTWLNPRRASNILFAQGNAQIFDERGLSNWVVEFGQFVNHDQHLDGGGESAAASESAPIPLPTGGDPVFNRSIPFERAAFDARTGTSANNPRQMLNMGATAFIDGSVIYGQTRTVTSAVRAPVGGLLASQDRPGGSFPPLFSQSPLSTGLLNPVRKTTLLAFGDFRANEQLGLSLMQTIWFREHNWHARRLSAAHPAWSSDQLFLSARRIVVAELQKVTLDYYSALGVPITAYSGYIPSRNPSGFIEFVAAAQRMGHSQIYDFLPRINAAGRLVRRISLADGFFSPELLYSESGALEDFVRGLSFTRAQRVDLPCVDGVRNLLFGRGMGMDLMAIDVARLADQGVPFHSQIRATLGLTPLTSVDAISSDATTRDRLRAAFGSAIQGIDLLTGGLSEDHVIGASMGETFQRLWWINLEQARTSDRFWFERLGALSDDAQEDADIRQQVRNTNLGDILARNCNVARDTLPTDVFFVPTAQ